MEDNISRLKMDATLLHYTCKNAASALQILCEPFSFTLEEIDDQCYSITTGRIYHMKHYVDTTFYQSSGLTRNFMFNGSIYYVLYLQILYFYLVGQYSLSLNYESGIIQRSEFTTTSPTPCLYGMFCQLMLRLLLLSCMSFKIKLYVAPSTQKVNRCIWGRISVRPSYPSFLLPACSNRRRC